MDNVQKHNNYINIPLPQTFRSYIICSENCMEQNQSHTDLNVGRTTEESWFESREMHEIVPFWGPPSLLYSEYR
jgi:hypothetical protein